MKKEITAKEIQKKGGQALWRNKTPEQKKEWIEKMKKAKNKKKKLVEKLLRDHNKGRVG